MKNRDPKVLRITQGAVIAALYVVLTMVFAPISFGPVQVRIAEALCILPMFTPAAIPGLFIGCLIANLIGGGIILDVIFGSIATLIGAVLVAVPVLMFQILLGEIAGCYVLGELLCTALQKNAGRIFKPSEENM